MPFLTPKPIAHIAKPAGTNITKSATTVAFMSPANCVMMVVTSVVSKLVNV